MIRLMVSAREGLWAAGFACILSLLPVIVQAAPFAAYVMDARTGEVLYENNAETRLHPASLTKMMTLYLTFQAIERGQINLDTKATISKNAAAEPPSRLGLKPGQKISVRYLIRAAALRSANDAATALGELIGGSEAAFADRMTKTARQLGMTKTTFKNANGLTASGHLSTAHDMTILGRRLFYDYPQYYNIFSRRSSDAGIAQVANTNRRFLDSYRGADGIKTGFTNPAGFNLTASAERDGKRIVASVFGGQSTPHRNAKMAELLDLGFRKAPSKVKVKAPALVAEADPETPGRRSAIESAIAAVNSANALRETTRVAQASRMAPSASGRPQGRPATPAPVVDTRLAATIRENISDIVSDVQQQDASRPSASLVITSAAPAARPTMALAAATEPQAGPAAAASLVTADPAAAMLAAEPPVARTAAILLNEEPEEEATGSNLDEEPAEPVVLAAVAAPKPRATPPAMAEPSAAALAPAPPEGPEVVTRLSTSGGRYWGINIGRYNSRYEAEKVLLRTALSEIGTLDGGLRKVVQRANGFDATFMGLSQDNADLACRRLAARNMQCFTVGP